MGYFDWLTPQRSQALSQALLGLGAGLVGQGATPYPQPFVSALARGGTGFAQGLKEGLANARRDPNPMPPGVAEHPLPDGAAPAASGTTGPGGARQAALPLTRENALRVAQGIVASGKPLWLAAPDGTIGEVTPDRARAWLEQRAVR